MSKILSAASVLLIFPIVGCGDRPEPKAGSATSSQPQAGTPVDTSPKAEIAKPEDLKSPTAIARKLRSANPQDRIEGCRAAAMLGTEAKPIARDICRAAIPQESQQAAYEALDKVYPEIVGFAIDLSKKKSTLSANQAINKLIQAKGTETGSALLPLIFDVTEPKAEDDVGSSRVGRAGLSNSFTLIGMIAPDDEESIGWLRKMASSTDREYRMGAVRCIGSIAAAKPSARPPLLPILLPLLQRPDTKQPIEFVRAVEAVARFGADAKEAIPLLEKQRFSELPLVRNAIAKALEAIGGKPEK